MKKEELKAFYADNKETIVVAAGTTIGTIAATWLVKKAARKMQKLFCDANDEFDDDLEDVFEDPFEKTPMHEVGDDPDEDLSDLFEEEDNEDSFESEESESSSSEDSEEKSESESK